MKAPSVSTFHRFRLPLALGFGLHLVACGDQPSIATPSAAGDFDELAAALIPTLATKLVSQGYLAATPLTLPTRTLTDDRAVQLATALVAQFGPIFEPTLERQAGRSIELTELRHTGRVVLAETPYQVLPESAENWLKARFGPAFIVTFTDGRGPAVAVSVSAYASAVDVSNGRLMFPARRGNEFRMIGVDNAGKYGIGFSATEAVLRTYRQFGVRVAAWPDYVRRGVDWMPFVGAWRVPLEYPVMVHVEHRGDTLVREIYLESDGSFTAPAGPMPSVATSQSSDGPGNFSVDPRPDLGRVRNPIRSARQGGA